jgi:hypothetical protein
MATSSQAAPAAGGYPSRKLSAALAVASVVFTSVLVRTTDCCAESALASSVQTIFA